ncbi:mannitol dehydrogenase family protein, partial [Azospirillum sp. INR13]|nr:mannitol dehydrogenase family protein [Azospirillum sp. INR13]
FRNPALRHRTWQIAMDGTQKLPQRLLNPIRERLAADQPIDRLVLAVAAWMRYVAGNDEKGQRIDVRDPLAFRLAEIAATAAGDSDQLAGALFGLTAVFGDDLPRDPRFTGPVTAALKRLFAEGARAVVAATA